MNQGNTKHPIHILAIMEHGRQAEDEIRQLDQTELAIKRIEFAETIEEADQKLAFHDVDIILLCYEILNKVDVRRYKKLRDKYIQTPFVLMTNPLSEQLILQMLSGMAEEYVVLQEMDTSKIAMAIYIALERKRQERKLQHECEKLYKMFQSVPIGVLMLDNETIVKYANEKIANMVLRSPSGMIGLRGGQSLGCIHSAEDPRGCGYTEKCLQCVLRQNIKHVLQYAEGIYNLKVQPTLEVYGQIVRPWLTINAEPLLLDGQKHVMVTVKDITEDKLKYNNASYSHAS